MRPTPSMTRKLFSASGLALATAMAAHAPVARAQSFNAGVAATFGSVTVANGTGTTTVTVSSPSAVINWTPNDTAATGGPIDFQSAGTTATFTNNPSGTSNFVLLNRIVPSGSTRPIQFNGSVISQLQGGAAGPTPGGSVFFYSPGGVLVGSQAVFNVGSLVLTASDLAFTGAGAFDTSGSYAFQQATVPGAQISVLPGAQITAPLDGSYIAMIAPSIANSGTVNVNGSAALVAADAATLRFAPNGLFDIVVNSGTSATGTVLANNGTITGPAAVAASGINHRMYMVAVPKNDAITMAFASGSALGFDIAGAADQSGNVIVLSAGQNVTGGSVNSTPSPGGGTGLAEIVGTDANFTSYMRSVSSGSFNMNSTSSVGLRFGSVLDVVAGGASSGLSATGLGTINAAGFVFISSDVRGTDAALTTVGKDTYVTASNGGTISFASDAYLSAFADGAQSTVPGTSGGAAIGGTVRVEASNGGQIAIAGDLDIYSTGRGGDVGVTGAGGGNGTGGTASLQALGTSGSAITVGQDLTIYSSGLGGLNSGCFACAPGDALGGAITIRASGANTISVGTTYLNAEGSARTISGSVGSSTGGTINIETINGGSLSFADVDAFADGDGESSNTIAGSGVGGTLNVISSGPGGGGMTFSGAVELYAYGSAGSAFDPGGTGATSTGGRVFISARDGTLMNFTNELYADSSGFSGSATLGSTAGTGGETRLDASNGGTIQVALNTTIIATGAAGSVIAPGTGSTGTGGLAQVTTSTNGSIQLASNLLVNANGTGSFVSGDTLAGNGIGGMARISGTSGGNLTVAGTANISATGTGGLGIDNILDMGGAGTGGVASVDLSGAQAGFSSTLTLDASGIGGVGHTTSGVGTGGNATINLLDSSLSATGLVYLGAIGAGGNTTLSGRGGNGQGGTARVALANSSANLLNSLTLEAAGNGGFGAGTATAAASGTGGLTTLTVNAGSMTVANTIQLLSDGNGGRGVITGDGGVGTGGTVNLIANGDSRGNSLISAPSYLLRANGTGGQGDGAGQQTPATPGSPGNAGGDARGGTALVVAAADGGTISGMFLNVEATATGGLGGDGYDDASTFGRGGNGGLGGSAIGGQITFDSFKGTGTGTGAVNVDNLNANVLGRAGNGGDAGFGVTRGDAGRGGSGTGGSINMVLDRGGSTINATTGINLEASALGGLAGDCTVGCAATGGAATGGTIFAGSGGSTTGNLLRAGTNITLLARADGGGSLGRAGGAATGGSVTLRAQSGLAIQTNRIDLGTEAGGGNGLGTSPAGAGQGGSSQLVSSGTGSINVSDSVFVGASGRGGDAFGTANAGGKGTGGLSLVLSNGGAINIANDVTVDSSGFGGRGNPDAASGTGGDGIGGESSFRVGGNAQLGNGGSISVGGTTTILSDGTGGDGFAAGAGTGGLADIYARQGTLTLGQVNAFASGSGGFGTLGGSGGAATGGFASIQTANAVEGPSQISFTQAIADASALGGVGSDGTVFGAPGGLGGAAQGGSVVVAGSAGNGTLQAGTVTAFADARGGDGGFASGASGGDGGLGSAGSVQIGTISSSDTGTVNTGSATFGSILASASAFGGAGGNTDTLNPNATGGNGGLASGGGTSVLVRGSPVTITGVASFDANATGGAGGSGPVAGLGGNASIGTSVPQQVAGAYALVTNRFNQPTQRGTLTATDLQFTSVATGGSGSTAGTSTNLGGAVAFRAINSDITATNLSFFSQAGSLATGGLADPISLVGSTGTISNGLTFSTSTNVSLTLDQSNLTGGQVIVSGANWVLDPVAPAALGTIMGTTSLFLSSGLDLVAYANVRSLGSLSITALGKIDLGALLATGFIDVTAGSSLTLDDVTSSGDSIDLTAAGAISTGNMTAATSITVDAPGAISTGNLVAGSGAPSAAGLGTVVLTSGGNVTTGSIAANSDFGISAVGTISTGSASAYDMLLLGGGNIGTGALNAGNRILIADASMAALGQTANGFDKELVFGAATVTATSGAISLVTPVTATQFRAATLSSFTSGAITVTPSATGSGLLRVDAGGLISAGNLTAANDITLNTASTLVADFITSSAGAIDLVASGPLTTRELRAGTAVTIRSQGQVVTDIIVAGTGQPSATATGLVSIRAGSGVETGSITASSDLRVVAGGLIEIGSASAYDMLLLGGAAIKARSMDAGNRVLIGDATMAALGQTATGFNKEAVFGAASLTATAGPIDITGPVTVTAFNAATLGAFTGDAVNVVPSATGSGLLRIDAIGAIVTTNLLAAKDVTLTSATSIQSGSVTSQTGGTTFSAPIINAGGVQAATTVSLTGQTITTGGLTATAQGGSVIGRASQTISTGAINAPGVISIVGTNQALVQSATSTNGLIEVTAGDVLNIGTVTGGRAVTLIAGTSNATGGLVAGQGRIAAGSVQGAGLVQIAAGGQVGTSNVRSTGDNVKIASFGSTITTGAITAARDVLVSGAQGVTIGANINARDVILLSGGNVNTAGILSGLVLSQSPTSPTGFAVTNAIGRVLIANSSLASGTLLLSTASDFSSLFVAPVSLSGSVNVTGQVVAGQFRSYSQGNMTGAAIAAFNSVEVESGGLITVGQRWGSPTIELISADIRIVDNGTLTNPNGQQILSGLRTSATGEIDLISISGSPALIGDGLIGSGYSLSAAEIGLISTHELFIGAVDVAANPVDMLIGNFALTAGGNNGSTTIGDATGSIHFVTGNRQTSQPGGAIRVVGNLTGSGFAQANVVEFNTGRFEIDAGTGSVALTQSQGTLGGTLEIHAANIHVASAAILDKLAADPFYAGHIAELNAPAAVQRPEGVLRALGLDLYPTGTLYVQNTGTTLDPAGFFADIDLATINTTANTAPASISIIVNGKWQTPTGVVSGFAARDLVVSTSDVLSFFTPDSTINGCAISASSCVPAMTVDPAPAISSQIQIVSNDALGNTPTFTAEPESSTSPAAASEQQDEPAEEAQTPEEAASEADDAASPIAPPPQIIDSTPLEPQQQVEQPVAGSGNPSLIGSVVNENSAEGDAQ